MPRATKPSPPSFVEVLGLLAAEAAVARASRALDAAKADRERIRVALKRQFPDGEFVERDDVGKRIRRRTKSSGRTFSLTKFEAKYEVTPEMKPFIGKGSTYDEWSIEDLVV